MELVSVYPANDSLGEGPVWNSDEQALYWLDILNFRLQRWQPDTNDYQAWTLPCEIGSYAFCETAGKVLVALKTGFHFLELKTGELAAITDPEEGMTDNRFNDGKCDRVGRFWAGTMGSGDAPTGALYRLDADLTCSTQRRNVGISNGLGWSPDSKVMYYTDSPLNKILAFDYDVETGSLSNERVFADIHKGVPDGLTVDSEGNVWSAAWNGWRVHKFSPDGTLVDEIELPTACPTSCTFGGPDLDELFITTARVILTEDELEQQPQAGYVFKVKTDVKGLLEPKFTM
ncbi:MAG: SMP-30/gluconolactonase/LRE family protein [Deinococcota bacterium]